MCCHLVQLATALKSVLFHIPRGGTGRPGLTLALLFSAVLMQA